MKKIIFALVFALGFTNIISAQQFSNLIIANGGSFEFSTPFQDRATIGAYDQVQGKYWVFDTIQVESVQDLVISGEDAFLAAESKVIKYDLTTYKRVAETDYAGVRSVSLHDTLLFVGKFYGSGSFLSVYDSRDLAFLYEVPAIDQMVTDVVVVGDTAYIPFNQKGTVDQWPPYGVYNDTIGKIGVLDLVNQSYVRTINLDTIGSGASNAFVYNNTVLVSCESNGVLTKYDVVDQTIDFDTVGVSSSIAMEDSLLIAHFNGVVGSYDFVQGSSTTNSLGFNVDAYSLASSAYDTLANQIILTETDFGSYGNALIFNDAGLALDTFAVNIAPQAIAVNYKSGAFAPIALNDYVETMEDSAGVTVDVLSSDFDPNGDELILTIIENPSNGVASVVNDSILYTPNAGYYGLDSVVYEVCDGVLCDEAILLINVVHISAVNEVMTLGSLKCYPNPVVDVINLETNIKDEKQWVIYDINGRVMRSDVLYDVHLSVDVSDLNKGVYLFKIFNGKEVEIARFVLD